MTNAAPVPPPGVPAPPRAVAAAPRALTGALWTIVGASVVMAIAAFLPWLSFGRRDVRGTRFVWRELFIDSLPERVVDTGVGYVTLAGAVVLAVLAGIALAMRARRIPAYAAGVVAVIGGLVAAFLVYRVREFWPDAMGIGVWLTLIAALVGVATGIVVLVTAHKAVPAAVSQGLPAAPGVQVPGAQGPAIQVPGAQGPAVHGSSAGGRGRQVWTVIGSAAVVAIAAVLPWASVNGKTVTGLSGGSRSDGLWTAIAAIAAIVLVLLCVYGSTGGVTKLRAGTYAMLAGLVAVVMSGMDLSDVGDIADSADAYGVSVDVSTGIGLYLTLLGGLALIASGAALAFLDRQPVVAHAPALGTPIPPPVGPAAGPQSMVPAGGGQPFPPVTGPQPAAPATGPQQEMNVKIDQLQRLGQLRDSGVLSDEEFEAKKREIL